MRTLGSKESFISTTKEKNPITLGSAERAAGTDFCSSLVREFKKITLNQGKPDPSLLNTLYKYAHKGSGIFRATGFSLEDASLKHFDALISAIAEKAYLDLITSPKTKNIIGYVNAEVAKDLKEVSMRGGGLSESQGRTFTHIDTKISNLADQVMLMGLPNDISLQIGEGQNSITIQTRDLEHDLQGESIFLKRRLPKLLETGTMGLGIATTLIACSGEAPPAKVAPLPDEEITIETKQPIEEKIDIPLYEIDGRITPTAQIPATAVPTAEPATAVPETETPIENTETREINFAENFDELTILKIDARSIIEADGGAPEQLKSVETAVSKKIKGNHTFSVRLIDGMWTSVAKNNDTGQIWYAVGTESGSVFPQLMPIGTDVTNEDSFEMHTQPMCEGCVEQVLASNGSTITIVSLDKDGNPLEWMNEAEEMVRVEVELEIEFPAWLDLPEDYIFTNPNEDKNNLIGATITTKEGKPLYLYAPLVNNDPKTDLSESVQATTEEIIFYDKRNISIDEIEAVETANGSEANESGTNVEGEWIKDYPLISEIDDYKQCKVPEEEMRDGTFLRWLKYIAGTLKFDPEKVVDVDFAFIGNALGYNVTNAPQFESALEKPSETNPFKNNEVFCYTETKNEDGEVLPYAVMPVFFWNRETGKTDPVIVVFAGYNPMDKENEYPIQDRFDMWKEQNITLIVASDQLPFGKGTDPLVAPTFAENDMNQVFMDTVIKNDASRLSKPGMIFLTKISIHEKLDWYR
jgi:hypothetical protein